MRIGRTASGSKRGNVLVGCLAALGVVVVLLIIVGIVVAMNWRSWTAAAIQGATTAAINEQQARGALPPGEGPEMIAELKVLNDALGTGQITFEEYGRFFEGPDLLRVFAVARIFEVELRYLPAAGLDGEAEAEGAALLQRFARGIEEGTIESVEVEQAFDPILTAAPAGSQGQPGVGTEEFRELVPVEVVTADEMNRVLESVETLVEDAGVAAEPGRVDLSEMLERKVDEVLGQTGQPGQPAQPGPDEAVDGGNAPAERDATEPAGEAEPE